MTQNFTQSADAREWARAFVEQAALTPAIATDEGTMIAWFANAIMRGWDEHARRYPTDALIRAVAVYDAQEGEMDPRRERDVVLMAAFALGRPHVDHDALEQRQSTKKDAGWVGNCGGLRASNGG